MTDNCICLTCSRSYKYAGRNTGMTRTKCNSCSTNLRRFKIKEKIVEYLGGKCVNCGYNKCKRALHAHHEDPTSKDFQISGAHARAWSKIKLELDKCILLCANCHAEEHEKSALVSPHSYKVSKG